ncbi:hypothetical protein, partial [Acinetobacter baumannii]|uniref:hypothetical protein n=1 Tax=Acinetobacter baumannii TaxID=470 RepID=UPI001C08C553
MLHDLLLKRGCAMRLKDVLDQFASRNKAVHQSFRCAPQQGCSGRHSGQADARPAQHPAAARCLLICGGGG